MATVNQIAASFVGMAQKNPAQRPAILRDAAYAFMGLAQDPKNARSAGQLAKIGLEFAAAARRVQPVVMDDFTDLLRETKQAYDEVGDDPMDLIAQRRKIHDQRTPVVPGNVSIAPESFNRDATLGRSAVIKFDPSPEEIVQGIQQSQNVAFWQGTKKEAQALTVDVSLGFLPTLAVTQGEVFASTNVRPFAEVEYGSDGNRTKVTFDVSFGNRCTIVGNYCAVTVGMGKPRPSSTAIAITAGASIGTFAAPSQAPLISTAYADFLGKGDSITIPIPLKAVQLLALQSGAAFNEKALLEFLDYGGDLITKVFYKQSDTSAMQPVPITGDVAFVRLTNDAGNAGAYDFRLPFQLGL